MPELARDHAGRGVGSHAAGVGPGVPLADPLVIFGRGQRKNVLAVGQGDERDLFARQVLLDDHPVAGGAEAALLEEGDQRLLELVAGLRDQHPLAGGQAVGLEHHRQTHLPGRLARLGQVVDHLAGGGRDGVALHELLGEDLAAFEPRGLPAGTEHLEPPAGELVRQTEGQRQLRADHGEVDLQIRGKARQVLDLVDRFRHQVGDLGDARVARGAVELVELRALGELPAQRVLASPGPDDQDSHGGSPSSAASAVIARASTTSSTEQPRDRSLIGRASPWSSGPIARAPARRSVSL